MLSLGVSLYPEQEKRQENGPLKENEGTHESVYNVI